MHIYMQIKHRDIQDILLIKFTFYTTKYANTFIFDLTPLQHIA